MPTLQAEADKLANPTLTKGVVEVFFDRGTRDHYALLPFKAYEGSSFDWNIEKTLPTGYSARDPYGSTAIPGGVGTRNRLSIKSAALLRNVDTAVIDNIGKSDINNQHMEDIIMGAKKFAEDHRRDFFRGNGTWNEGTGYNLSGLDYYLDKYAGRYQSGALVSGAWGSFVDQKYFPTTGGSAGTPYGTKANLDLGMLDDLLTREKGLGFDVVFSDRKSFLSFKKQLNAVGGQVAPALMDERFGRPVYEYNGVLWVVNDAVGAPKISSLDVAASVTITVTTGALSVNTATDKYWPGFQDTDIGRTFTLYSDAALTTVAATGTISDITGSATATTTYTTATKTGYIVLDQANLIYGIRYNEMDGVTAVYHNSRGVPPNAGEYQGPIAGFAAVEIGDLEDAPLTRTRLEWYGNYVALSPYSVARMSHFIA